MMGSMFWRFAHHGRDAVSTQERRRLILGDAAGMP
jgi:hypothetical protein